MADLDLHKFFKQIQKETRCLFAFMIRSHTRKIAASIVLWWWQDSNLHRVFR